MDICDDILLFTGLLSTTTSSTRRSRMFGLTHGLLEGGDIPPAEEDQSINLQTRIHGSGKLSPASTTQRVVYRPPCPDHLFSIMCHLITTLWVVLVEDYTYYFHHLSFAPFGTSMFLASSEWKLARSLAR